jgi:predicted MFS family arabinose efflux permease
MDSPKAAGLTPGSSDTASFLDGGMVLILAVICGLSVGNVYFNQPLLADMGRTFNLPVQQVGWIPTATQVGYATGLLLLAPLGDRLERRKLIVTMMLLIACALVAVAVSPNFLWLCIASLVLGFTTMASHLIIPLVAQVTVPQERGRVIGTLMGGVVMSLLLARAVSGVVGSIWNWRTMYWIVAALFILGAVVLWKRLPLCPPVSQLPYRKLMGSLVKFAREQPILREAALNNALVFASFNAFWSTLIFFLESPAYNYKSNVAGLFALIGVIGAFASPIVGRLADQRGARALVGLAVVLGLFSFIFLWVAGTHLAALILGVAVLDLAMHVGYLANQIRVYSLVPNAESRVNTVFMVINYSGGATGSLLGAFSWANWQWSGVCGLGCLLLSIAAIAHFGKGKLLFQKVS